MFLETQNMVEQFHLIAEKVRKKWSIPGLSYALIKGNEVIYSSGLGFADSNGTETTAKTLFRIGSNSKAFACAALLELEEQKELSIDSKIENILMDFSFQCPELTKKVCISDLVTHQCGVGKFTSSMMSFLGYDHADIINAFECIPVLKGYRKSFQYQNGLYLVATKIINQVTKKSNNDFFSEIFYKPLKMSHTSSGIKDSHFYNLATPHDVYDDKTLPICQSPFADAIGAGGNVVTCAEDLAKWLQYNIENFQKSKENVRHKQYSPYILFPHVISENFTLGKYIRWQGYCLGWYQANFEGRDVYEHLGGVPGYTSYLSFIPECGVGIVLLCNKSNMRYPLELLRLNFFELAMRGQVTELMNILYDETENYKLNINKSLCMDVKKELPKNLQNRCLHGYNPIYKSIWFVTNQEESYVLFENVNYKVPCIYIGGGSFIALDKYKNFSSIFKKVLFQVSESGDELSMEIFMDDQKGQLTWIEKQRFYNFDLSKRFATETVKFTV